jgi:spore maturation protein SpmA
MADWKKYTLFSITIQGKDGDALKKHVTDVFPDIKCRSPGACLLKAVKTMYESRVGDELGLFILKALYPEINRLYPNRKTLRKNLSAVRKVIKLHQSASMYGKSQLSEYFNLNSEERTTLVDDYKANITLKNNNKTEINQTAIFKSIHTLISSDNTYDMILLVLISTGCRLIEVLFKSKISVEGSNIRVEDMAKKRAGAKKTFILKPTIAVSAKYVVDIVKEIRQRFEDKGVQLVGDDGGVHKQKATTVNAHFKKIFPYLANNHHASGMLRKIYAVLSFKLFQDPNNVNMNIWIQKVLGHESIEPSFAYSSIHLVNRPV